ncbi:protein canopy homolog 4-like [Dendronephthya gigantea]|uniref:protein canopy homolog 4-like n=1 Tax=Dendronephthya gigantea TaxID=151771 RepID=UPI00106CFA45|nr:protein canopy homolog 4-like [Dendronephthya gigantea]
MYLSSLHILLLFCGVTFISENIGVEDEFIAVDGIRVRKLDQMNVRLEQKTKEEMLEMKDIFDEEEAKLYNESKEDTKKLPTKCQVCRLMVTEIQRKLKIFGKVKTVTSKGRPVYYKDDMVIWHVFDELCAEMKKYNIDKKTPFRYRRGVKSFLRRQADEMTAHAPNVQWVWNVDAADIDDPTGEIKRLEKQCYNMLVKYQDDIRRWFYASQESNPLKWLCANKVLSRRSSQGCLWIKDKYIEELVKYDEPNMKEETAVTDTNHDKKHHEI